MIQRICLLLILVALPVAASAEVAEIPAATDSTIYEHPNGSTGNSLGSYFFSGKTATGSIRRGLVAFDVAAHIPPGATIDSVTLKLHMSMTIAGPTSVGLHRVTTDWGEGTSAAAGEEGGGTNAEAGDATWLHSSFPTDFWSTAGGDFDPASSAATVVTNFGSYSWSTAGMTADVQAWLDDADADFGWAVVGDESTATTAKRFDSKDHDDRARHPLLTVEYTPADNDDGEGVPAGSAATTALTAMVLLLLLGLCSRRRSPAEPTT